LRIKAALSTKSGDRKADTATKAFEPTSRRVLERRDFVDRFLTSWLEAECYGLESDNVMDEDVLCWLVTAADKEGISEEELEHAADGDLMGLIQQAIAEGSNQHG